MHRYKTRILKQNMSVGGKANTGRVGARRKASQKTVVKLRAAVNNCSVISGEN